MKLRIWGTANETVKFKIKKKIVGGLLNEITVSKVKVALLANDDPFH